MYATRNAGSRDLLIALSVFLFKIKWIMNAWMLAKSIDFEVVNRKCRLEIRRVRKLIIIVLVATECLLVQVPVILVENQVSVQHSNKFRLNGQHWRQSVFCHLDISPHARSGP